MPSFNPFTSVASRNACALFEIRLESDFIVFRGSTDEASGQLLKGVVVLCLREPLRVEDVHLRLTGSCRIAWMEGKQTPTGIHNQKIDRTKTVLRHSWPPFVFGNDHHSHILAAGNYEWPFELLLEGNTLESVEGLYQTGISYFLKATVSRGKLAKNLHAFKRVRIIRTLDPAALEFNHAMSVENIWPNKVEYSIVIPQKAVVFGSNIPLEMRFTPLLKGLEMGEITVRLLESQEFSVPGIGALPRIHKAEREVTNWHFEVKRNDHWQDNIEETGQEGWKVTRDLPLVQKLSKCLQDCTAEGIKIRHKIKLTVALKNPDGHVSELRATLPVTIFISPMITLDDDGNVVSEQAQEAAEGNVTDSDQSNMAPPGYGLHVLDQLYENVDPSITPNGMQSGINTPFYAQSRAGSHENLSQLASGAVTPAALSSRLQNVSLDPTNRNNSYTSMGSHSGINTPSHAYSHDGDHTAESSMPQSAELSRQTSAEEHHSPETSGHSTPPEHLDAPDVDMAQLSKVPSYNTATRTPLARNSSFTDAVSLPDYFSVMSAPNSPTRAPVNDPLATITEDMGDTGEILRDSRPSRRPSARRSNSLGFASFLSSHSIGDHHGERLSRLLPSRGAPS
ncbi:arrestin [Apiospora kogelbergensis]|uniref:Arrestin n=1 Tax=Apiospora kogelbergensis TaxID=1337665 RepID=A0AAW0QYP6_9PEZI